MKKGRIRAAAAASPSQSLFQYSSIRPDHFRVFDLIAVSPTINIRLADQADNDICEYYALSYAWGHEDNTEPIICNGLNGLSVTPHLKEGLSKIYGHVVCPRLWVDAICINQDSAVEKAEQVKKMHLIYQRANCLLVWLGGVIQDSNEFLEEVKSKIFPFEIEGTGKFLAFNEIRLDATSFMPMVNLSRRPWFRRLWTMQEYFHGKSVAYFCGDQVLKEEELRIIVRKLSFHPFGGLKPPEVWADNDPFIGFLAWIELNDLKRSYWHYGMDSGAFFDSVVLGRRRYTKEPVDRIFAALGIAQGDDEIYKRHIKVDYSPEFRCNCWNTFKKFAQIALLYEPNLRLLSVATSEEMLLQLPSWCPNLSSPAFAANTDLVKKLAAGWPWTGHLKQLPDLHYDRLRCSKHPHFRGKRENHLSLSPSGNVVNIWGAQIGWISELGPPKQWTTGAASKEFAFVQPLAKKVLDWLLSSQEVCINAFKSRESGRVALAKMIFWAVDSARVDDTDGKPNEEVDDDLDPEAKLARLSSELSRTITDNQFLQLHDSLLTTLENVVKKDSGNAWLEEDCNLRHEYSLRSGQIRAFEKDWHHRLLFATDTGFVGCASERVAQDDRICMFYGGKSLYVLRQHGSIYEFISDAYVYRAVNGEVFEMLDQGLVQEELFSIS